MRIHATRVDPEDRRSIRRGETSGLRRLTGCSIIFAGFAVLAVLTASCQERAPRQFPRVELFVGYSHADLNLGSQSSLFVPASRNFNGGLIDTKINVRNHLALLLDFAAQSGHSTIPDPLGYEDHMELDTTQFLAGPEFTVRTRSWNTFAHALFGLTRTSLSELNGYTECFYSLPAPAENGCPNFVNVAHRTNVAFGFGGGLERNWKKHFAFRLIAADYIPTRLDGRWEGQFRLGTGVILKF